MIEMMNREANKLPGFRVKGMCETESLLTGKKVRLRVES